MALNDDHAGRRRLGHEPALDGVRGIAVLVVVLWHYPPDILERSWFWLKAGHIGVDLFFVLSGFLITALMLNEKNETGAINFAGFYRRRVFRLLPALFLFLAAHVVFANLTDIPSIPLFQPGTDGVDQWMSVLGAAFFFLNWLGDIGDGFEVSLGLAHLWSLSVEEQFYLVWPTVVVALLSPRRSLNLVAVGAAVSALAYAGHAYVWNTHGARWAFTIGLAAAVFGGFVILRDRVGRPAWVVGVITTLIAATLLYRYGLYEGGPETFRLYSGTPGRADSLMVGAGFAFAWTQGWVPRRCPTPLALAGWLFLAWVLTTRTFAEPFFFEYGWTVVAVAAGLALWGALGSEGTVYGAVLSFAPLRDRQGGVRALPLACLGVHRRAPLVERRLRRVEDVPGTRHHRGDHRGVVALRGEADAPLQGAQGRPRTRARFDAGRPCDERAVRRLAGARMRTAETVDEIVASGLCIGCGLCETISAGAVTMVRTSAGSLRPSPVDGFTPAEEAAVTRACPGTTARPRTDGTETLVDLHWGAMREARYAWARDPDVRFRAATGGALTALGCHVLDAGEAAFVLHVGAVPGDGLHSRWVISETPAEVIANAGSRYGPTAPLAGLGVALDRGEPFAVIAKPCDLGAIHAHAATDPRVDELCTTRLAMVCGGQSRLSKSLLVLDEFGVEPDEVSVFRYRGYGNPGRARVETHDGRAFEKTYREMWEDEGTWMLEARCTLCPDALGEAADVAALDVWPGGSPTGEDAGFNGIVVRTALGAALVDAAAASGHLVVGDELDPATLNDMQPHQVRKKERLAIRFATLAEADKPVIDAAGLRLDELGATLDPAVAAREAAGTRRRIDEGRWTE